MRISVLTWVIALLFVAEASAEMWCVHDQEVEGETVKVYSEVIARDICEYPGATKTRIKPADGIHVKSLSADEFIAGVTWAQAEYTYSLQNLIDVCIGNRLLEIIRRGGPAEVLVEADAATCQVWAHQFLEDKE